MTSLNHTLSLPDWPKQQSQTSGVDLLLVSKAGFWVRAAAYSLDQLLLNMLVLTLGLLALVMLTYGGILETGGDIFNLSYVGWLKYISAISWGRLVLEGIYFTLLHGYSGQTVGKLIMNLRVVTTAGERLNYRRAFKRWLGYFASSFILGIGYLMVAFTQDKQGLHDKIAATYVVRL